jgi:hypothetical protein
MTCEARRGELVSDIQSCREAAAAGRSGRLSFSGSSQKHALKSDLVKSERTD